MRKRWKAYVFVGLGLEAIVICLYDNAIYMQEDYEQFFIAHDYLKN